MKNENREIKINKKKLLALIVGIIILGLGIFFVVRGIENFSANNVVNSYASAMKEYDAEKLAHLYHPDVIEKLYDGKIDTLINLLDNNFKLQKDLKIVVLNYKIDEEFKQLKDDEFKKYVNTFNERYNLKNNKIESLRRYNIEFEIDNVGTKEVNKTKIIIAEIDGDWYFVDVE